MAVPPWLRFAIIALAFIEVNIFGRFLVVTGLISLLVARVKRRSDLEQVTGGARGHGEVEG